MPSFFLCGTRTHLNMVSYVIRQNRKHFRRFFLSHPSVTKHELKTTFSKYKGVKIVAHHTRSYGHFRAPNIQHPLPEMYCCQTVNSVQPDYIQGLCLTVSCTTEAHES